MSPRDCQRARHSTAACSACGEQATPAHSPLYLKGTFCSRCCPCLFN